MKEALIATISTVVGTLLGWVLANIKTGKIDISIDNFIETAHYTNPSSVSIPGKENYEIFGLTLTFDIQLHNSSATNKAIRDCILIFLDAQGKELLSQPVCDLATRHKYGGGYKSDPIAAINVEAYKSYNINAEVNLWESAPLANCRDVVFRYKTERYKSKEIAYKKIEFSKIPRYNTEAK